MNIHRLIIGTTLLGQATLLIPGVSDAADMWVEIGMKETTTSVPYSKNVKTLVQLNLESIISPLSDVFWKSEQKDFQKTSSHSYEEPLRYFPQQRRIEDNFSVNNDKIIMYNVQSHVNGILSFSIENARVSIIKSGLQFNYDLINDDTVLNTELTKNHAFIWYEMKF